MSTNITVTFTDRSGVKSKLRAHKFDDKKSFDICLNAFEVLSKIRKQDLSVISSIRSNKKIELYDHQLFAALKVKNEFGGSAILADEVGLGKTIEAGIILKEFITSGIAKSVLILTPPSLVYQWQDELLIKFGLDFIKQFDDPRFVNAGSHDMLIMSHSSAVFPKHSQLLKSRSWDMVIVDEAHSMKNANTKKHRLLNEISRKFTLFLSATPIQNNLEELYNLVELLRPATFGTLNQFKTKYAEDSQMRKLNSFFREDLQKILSSLMIRTTRREVKSYIKFTNRIAKTEILKPSSVERELYDRITDVVRYHYNKNYNLLHLMIIQRLISSSTESTKIALHKMKKSVMIEENEYNDLIKLADEIKIDTKAKILLDTINSSKNEKFLIFTEFYSTQDYLSTLLTANGYSVTIFNGKMNLSERENSINNFKTSSQIMISTSAGGEGQNFQFCNNVVNYDLPWNPMRVEQRVGRVHRIGQKNDVFIYNYAYEKTIDAYILELLYAKIKLFTMSIGDLDLLFEDIDDKKSESMIFKEFMNGKSDQEVKNNLTALGNNWENNTQSRIEAVKKFNAEVFDNFSLSTLQVNQSNA